MYTVKNNHALNLLWYEKYFQNIQMKLPTFDLKYQPSLDPLLHKVDP